MAVPGSGALSLGGLAAEKDVDDYTDVDYDDVLSLKDLTIGGNANGNSFSADTTNLSSASKPNSSAPFAMSEWYSYDHDASSLGGDGTNWHAASYYASGTVAYNGYNSASLGHTSKANACADTSTVQTCSVIMWRGTLGNGTTMYFQWGNTTLPDAAVDGSNFSYMRLFSTWSNITISNGSTSSNSPAQSTGNDAVFQVNSSGVVSGFGGCTTNNTQYPITSLAYAKPVFACGQATNSTAYFLNTSPAVGQTVYTNSTNSTTLGAGNWGVNILASQSNRRMTTNSSGVITFFGSC